MGLMFFLWDSALDRLQWRGNTRSDCEEEKTQLFPVTNSRQFHGKIIFF